MHHKQIKTIPRTKLQALRQAGHLRRSVCVLLRNDVQRLRGRTKRDFLLHRGGQLSRKVEKSGKKTRFSLGVFQVNALEVGDGAVHREARPLVRYRHEVPVHCLKEENRKRSVVSQNNVQDKEGERG